VGEIYAGVGNHAQAVEFWERYIRVNPAAGEDAAFLAQLAEQLWLSGAGERAVLYLRRASKLLPADRRLGLCLGRMYVKLGHGRLAVAELMRVVGQEPQNAEAHFWLGKAYLLLAKKHRALSHLKRALQLCPTSSSYRQAVEKLEALLKKEQKGER
jgi:anaphase-promoting complex subunit 3